eukprot:13273003-Alexandrium_andersonii.AAC.1
MHHSVGPSRRLGPESSMLIASNPRNRRPLICRLLIAGGRSRAGRGQRRRRRLQQRFRVRVHATIHQSLQE